MRWIEKKDIDQCVELVRQFLALGKNYRDVPISEAKVRNLCDAAIVNPSVVFCMLAEEDGRIIGGMLGIQSEHTFSEQRAATEVILYVDEAHRGSSLGLRLVRAFEGWAQLQGCKHVNVGVSIGIDDEKAVKFYKALGYDSFATSLRKVV